MSFAIGSPILSVLYVLIIRSTKASYTDSWRKILRSEVQRWPHVPTAEKTLPWKASSRSASGKMMTALLPPSSKIVRPNLLWTSALTERPTAVEPVNEIKGTLGSFTIAAPTL